MRRSRFGEFWVSTEVFQEVSVWGVLDFYRGFSGGLGLGSSGFLQRFFRRSRFGEFWISTEVFQEVSVFIEVFKEVSISTEVF